MAKRVIWTLSARSDRKQILDYWRQRNKSNTYSKKLNKIFQGAIEIISVYPQIGNPTTDQSVRVKAVKDYLLVYEESETHILILRVWDTRQEPKKFKENI